MSPDPLDLFAELTLDLSDAELPTLETNDAAFVANQIATLLMYSGHSMTEIKYFAAHIGDDQEDLVRLICLLVLSSLGEEAKTSLPTVEEQISSSHRAIRLAATNAVYCIKVDSIDPDTIVAISNLSDREMLVEFKADLNEIHHSYLSKTAKAEKQFANQSKTTETVLLHQLRSGAAYEKRNVLRALARHGYSGQDFNDVVLGLLNESDVAIKRLAEKAIGAYSKQN